MLLVLAVRLKRTQNSQITIPIDAFQYSAAHQMDHLVSNSQANLFLSILSCAETLIQKCLYDNVNVAGAIRKTVSAGQLLRTELFSTELQLHGDSISYLSTLKQFLINPSLMNPRTIANRCRKQEPGQEVACAAN